MDVDLNLSFADLDEAIAKAQPWQLPGLVVALSARLAAAAARQLAERNDEHARGTQVEPNRNFSVEEAAARLGVSRDWLYHNAKRLPFTVRIGRRLLFSARELERWNRQRHGRG